VIPAPPGAAVGHPPTVRTAPSSATSLAGSPRSASQPGAGAPSTTSSHGWRLRRLRCGRDRGSQPSLTARAGRELQAAAENRNVTNGQNGKDSVVRIASADGYFTTILPLTPRRADFQVEHGANRDQLIGTT